MKIALDATVLQSDLTGIGKYIMGLYEACVRIDDGLRVTAIHRKELKCSLPERVTSGKCRRWIPKDVWRSMYMPVDLLRNRYDVVHFPWNGGITGLRPNCVVVSTIYDVLPLVIPKCLTEKQEAAYRMKIQRDIDRSDVLFTCSRYSGQEIMRNFRVRREPVVVYAAPDTTACDEMTDIGINVPYFLYVGGYDRRKGIESLLKVYLGLRREGRLTHKLLLTGSPRSISAEFSELRDFGVQSGYVQEMGYVSEAMLHSLYRKATALVYPSRYEGFGLPPVEAMASGCPVVTTAGTSIPEVCGDAVCYVDPEDDRDFAEALIELETNPEFGGALAVKGTKQAALFNWDSSAKVFLDELHRACREAGREH